MGKLFDEYRSKSFALPIWWQMFLIWCEDNHIDPLKDDLRSNTFETTLKQIQEEDFEFYKVLVAGRETTESELEWRKELFELSERMKNKLLKKRKKYEQT